MNSDELLTEIRELRQDIKELKKEFYLFKGKSAALITFLTAVSSYIVDLIKHGKH